MANYAEVVRDQAMQLGAYRNMTQNILLRLKYPVNVLVPSGVTAETEIIEMIEKLQSKLNWYERIYRRKGGEGIENPSDPNLM